jgi:hypothetical protein
MQQQDTNSYDSQAGVSETSTELAASWNESQEKLLKAIAERSNCMRWLHTQCNLYFENMNFFFTIPNVVISTVNGSITMSLNTLFPGPDEQKVATTVIGLISILSAVLITMNQYMKSQQMAEAHHAAGLAYGKLYRTITNELALRRDQRTNGLEFLKYVRGEIDRLENSAPSVPPFIVKRFNQKFLESSIEKPEITGDLDPVEINVEAKQRKGSLTDVKQIYSDPSVGGTSICDQPVAMLKAAASVFTKSSASPSVPHQVEDTTSDDVRVTIGKDMHYGAVAESP